MYTLYVYDFYCWMFFKKIALKCVENVLIVNINLKCDAKTHPCSKTTNEKGKGGYHTNEISILKFRFRKLKKITLMSMFRVGPTPVIFANLISILI